MLSCNKIGVTMLIKLNKPYKSIVSINEITLPDFVIITGRNGSGKTQLLQAIHSKNAVISVGEIDLENVKNFSGQLWNISSSTFHGSKIQRYAIALTNKISGYVYNRKNNPQLAYYNFDNYFSDEEKRIIESVKNEKKDKYTGNVKSWEDQQVGYMDQMEIMRHLPINFSLNERDYPSRCDIFSVDLSQIFKRYHIRKHQNDYNCYLRDVKGRADVEALSDDEFVQKYGEPPWVLANEILASANIGYRLTTPECHGADDSYTAKLINELNDVEISFEDLSSGEKVIISLFLALYNSQYDRIYPDALLLDEPDCHLHPSMTLNMLNVIDRIFVQERGVKVIMTTHSPSTLALAREECLYVMSSASPRLSKQKKDVCIKILTSGVPALSVEFENRLQVFVESKFDARNYGDIYEILKIYLASELSLNFIPSGAGGSGSCEQVRDIVLQLRSNGNYRIYGIVDWDLKNIATDFVKVISSGARYSIESVIFDPLVVGIFLLREKLVRADEVGLEAGLSYISLSKLGVDGLSKISDFVVNRVNLISKADTALFARVAVSYLSGANVVVPDWYLKMNGHTLETNIKAAFPILNRFRGENDLKSQIINKVMTDFPGYIPSDFHKLFREIQDEYCGRVMLEGT